MRAEHAPGRHRRAGVTLMGIGFGLMVLIGFAGESPSSAVGVGGFVVILGLAFFINSLFELLGGFFALNHCRVLHAHKQMRGVSFVSAGFFTLWGFWNLYYYTALAQPLSFFGAVFLVAANAFYLGMMAYYRSTEAHLDEHCIYLGTESAALTKSGDQS